MFPCQYLFSLRGFYIWITYKMCPIRKYKLLLISTKSKPINVQQYIEKLHLIGDTKNADLLIKLPYKKRLLFVTKSCDLKNFNKKTIKNTLSQELLKEFIENFINKQNEINQDNKKNMIINKRKRKMNADNKKICLLNDPENNIKYRLRSKKISLKTSEKMNIIN